MVQWLPFTGILPELAWTKCKQAILIVKFFWLGPDNVWRAPGRVTLRQREVTQSENTAEISLVCVDWSWDYKWQHENQNIDCDNYWPFCLSCCLNTRKTRGFWNKRQICQVSRAPHLHRSAESINLIKVLKFFLRWNLICLGQHLGRIYCRFLWQCCSALGWSVSFKESLWKSSLIIISLIEYLFQSQWQDSRVSWWCQ